MVTETPETAAALTSTIEKLRSDLENVQRELDQALGVWRQALISEKREFQSALQAKQRQWDEQEATWHDQRQAYEEKIGQLESTFQTQLSTAEQNALRALNELDDAWQRDKLNWQQTQQKRVKELENRDGSWQAEQERLKARIEDLEAQLAQASKPESRAALQDIQESWERDRLVWQESVRQTLQQLHEREAAWNTERQQQELFLNELRGSLESLQNRLEELETYESLPEQLLLNYLESLEHQVAAIESFVSTSSAGR